MLASITANLWVLISAPYVDPDTPSYFDVDLSGRSRLPVVPIIYSTLSSHLLIEVAQLTAAGASWAFLAIELGYLVRQRTVRIALVVAVVLLGASPGIANWNGSLMSESFSTSLLVVLSALTFATLRTATMRLRLLWCAAATAWLLCRPQNLLLAIAAVLVTGPLILIARRQLRWAVLTMSILCVLAVPLVVRNTQIRAENIGQVISARILTDADARAWWYKRGLPRHSCLQSHVGAFVSCIYHDPPIHHWLTSEGPRIYGEYLLSTPVAAILTPVANGFAPRVQSGNTVEPTAPALLFAGAAYHMPGSVRIDPWRYWWLDDIALGLVLLGVCVHFARTRRVSSIEAVGLTLVLLAVSWLIPTWNGAGFELARLALGSAVLTKLGIVCMAAGLLDG